MGNRILVVDDYQSVREGMLKALKGYCNYSGELKAVENGEKAIDEVHKKFYDICFLDINLPGISGVDVMEKMRDISPETKVVIMTGNHLDDEKKNVIENNADLFIAKPVDLDIVKDFISRELKIDKSKDSTPQWDMIDKRTFPRIPCNKTVNCSISVFYNWKLISSLEIHVSDTSYGGACIRSLYPLYPGNVLRFHSSMSNKSAIVQWCIDKKEHYRAGIKFI